MKDEERVTAVWATFTCPCAGYVIVSTQVEQKEMLRVGPFRSISFDRSGSAYGIPLGRDQELVPIADLWAHGTWTVDNRHLPSGSGGLYRLMRIDAALLETP